MGRRRRLRGYCARKGRARLAELSVGADDGAVAGGEEVGEAVRPRTGGRSSAGADERAADARGRRSGEALVVRTGGGRERGCRTQE
jgi:hypothetical protein